MRVRTPRIVLLAVLAPLLLLAPLPDAVAAEDATEEIDREALDKDRRQKASRNPVSTRVSRYLNAAAEAVDEEDPQEAKRLLNRLNMNALNRYERVLIYRMLAYVSYGANESEEAIANFKKVLELEMLPIKDEAKVRFYIAQLYASLQQWAKSIEWMKIWLIYAEEPDPLGFYLMGIAYYQLEDFDQAIAYAKKANELSPEPRESWLRLLAALYSREQDHANAALVLEELVLRFPKKPYWVQLSLIYGAKEDYRRSLAVQQVAYAQGFLTEDKELRRLARSYLYHDLPYPAARVLDKAIEEGAIARDSDSYELLANSWIAAREYERSIAPLRKAAGLSEDGNLYVRLGQVYMQREVWDEAWMLLEKAVQKGGLKNPGNAELLLGITLYNDAHVDRARTSFMRAMQHDSTRAAASGWISHLDTESNAPAS
jgi:tetratricopeptide (TPR) repeat protein